MLPLPSNENLGDGISLFIFEGITAINTGFPDGEGALTPGFGASSYYLAKFSPKTA